LGEELGRERFDLGAEEGFFKDRTPKKRDLTVL
jgi:hypothetical protein